MAPGVVVKWWDTSENCSQPTDSENEAVDTGRGVNVGYPSFTIGPGNPHYVQGFHV